MGTGAARRLTAETKLPDRIWRLRAHDLNMLTGLYVLRVETGSKRLKSGTANAAQVFTITPAAWARKVLQMRDEMRVQREFAKP
jgi:hypothetical protein